MASHQGADAKLTLSSGPLCPIHVSGKKSFDQWRTEIGKRDGTHHLAAKLRFLAQVLPTEEKAD